MSRFDPGLYVGRDELGAVTDDLQSQIDEGAQQAALAVVGVDVPIIDGTFAPVFTQGKKGKISVTLRFTGFGSAVDLKVVFVARAEILSAADYDQKRFSGKLGDKITPGNTSWTSRVDVALDPSTQYDVIRLVAIGGDGTERAANPTPDPVFSGYPGNILLTFTTPAQVTAANAPSKPTTPRIVRNVVDPDSDGSVSITTLRIFGDETETKDFALQGTVSVQPKVVDDGGFKAPAPPISIDDPSALFIDDAIGGLLTGRVYTWTKNSAFDSDGLKVDAPATSTITFIAGGFADPSDALANLTFVSVTFEATEDPSLLLVTFTLHQPTPAYKLKNYTAKRKVSTNPDSDYDLPKNLVVQRDSLVDPVYSTPGNIAITFPMNVKPAKTYRVKITVRSIGGFTKDFTSGDIAASALTQSARLGAAGGGPSLVDGGSLIASVKDYADLESPPGAGGDADFPGRLWQTSSNSGTKINNRASGAGGATIDSVGIRWRTSDKRLQLATNIFSLGGKPATRLGKLFRADDACVICPLFIADTADVTVNISFALVDQTAGDIVVVTAAGFVISHTDPTRYMGILIVPSGYVGTDKQWLELRLGSNPSQNCYTWNWQLDWGVLYRDFKANGDEQAVLNFLNTTPTSAGSGSGNIITEDDEGTQISPDGTRAGRIVLF